MNHYKEIQQKLLEHYQKCIQEAPRGNREVLGDYIQSTWIDKGLCYCALNVFGEDIYEQSWAQNIHLLYPGQEWVVEDVITKLQERVDILKELIK